MGIGRVRMKFLLLVMLLCASQCLLAQASNSAFVFVRPERTRLWNTVSAGDVTLPIVFPSGAKSASLTVSAPGYAKVYSGIVAREVAVALPPATDLASEAIYDLTLVFDGTAVTNKARLAVISGYTAGTSGSTRCLLPYASARWGRVAGDSAVVPIPLGATAFSVDGSKVASVDGAASWELVNGILTADRVLALEKPEGTWEAVLTQTPGFLLQLR